MYTPEILLNIACLAEEHYLSETDGFIKQDARREMKNALDCAAWMEKNGIAQMNNIGPFCDFVAKRGNKVRVRKGATIYSTHPSFTREGSVSSRAQVVTVHNMSKGYLDYSDDSSNPEIVPGRLTWAGAGGYWKWTDIDNVELIEQEEMVC